MDESEKEKLERVRIKSFSELLDAFLKKKNQKGVNKE